MSLINNPAGWKFLAGSGSAYLPPEDSVQHLIALGANGSYDAPYLDGLSWADSIVYPNGATQKTQHIRVCNELHRLGGLYEMQQAVYSWASTPIYHNGVTSSFSEAQINLMLNLNGEQPQYIQWVKDWLNAGLNPDIIQIINEMRWDTTDFTQEFGWEKYIAFCNLFMQEISAVKPNCTFSVSSMPNYDLNNIIGRQFQVPSGCKLIIDWHWYYCLDGLDPTAEYQSYMQPYWDADGPSAQGKQNLYQYMTDIGLFALVDSLKNTNIKIFWNEFGSHLYSRGAAAVFKDVVELATSLGIGVCFLNDGPHCAQAGTGDIYLPYNDPEKCGLNGGEWSWNFSPGALWNNRDFTLNALGVAWQQAYANIPNPVTLPLHDVFTNPALPNWNKINGTWNAT